MPANTPCPICQSPTAPFAPPYVRCTGCSLGFQVPLPAKVYETKSEMDAEGRSKGHEISEQDKAVNQALAHALVTRWLPGRETLRVLDVGCRYPVLAKAFVDLVTPPPLTLPDDTSDEARAALEAQHAAHRTLLPKEVHVLALDAIADLPRYGAELDVPFLQTDFEIADLDELAAEGPFDLITLVHVFDRFRNPQDALVRLRKLLKPNGLVYLRIPDGSTPGWDRYVSGDEASARPYFYCLSSVLEMLAQAADRGAPLFSVQDTYSLTGAGQRDYLLRPLDKKPTIALGMIVRNEERDLPRCLASVKGIVDQAFLIDTGSTDRTLEVARETLGDVPLTARTYLGASELDEESGEYKLWNFAQARNEFVNDIDASDADLLLWMDADDELLAPRFLARLAYWDIGAIGVRVDIGWKTCTTHHRLWRTRRGIRFVGPCHEYPELGSVSSTIVTDSVIRHDGTPHPGIEDSNPRNLRILLRELEKLIGQPLVNVDASPNAKLDPRKPIVLPPLPPAPIPYLILRTVFYLGYTYRDAARYPEAIAWFDWRLKDVGFRDEWLFAYLHKGRCLRELAKHSLTEKEDMQAETAKVLMHALAEAPDWCEFAMELSYLQFERNCVQDSLAWALYAVNKPIVETSLWREPDKYRDQPARYISWCYEHLGKLEDAIEWAHKAKLMIGGPDQEWDDRIKRLLGMRKPQIQQGPSREKREKARAKRK